MMRRDRTQKGNRVTTYSRMRWDVDNGIAALTLNRPQKLNAFDVTMGRELEDVFLDHARSDDVRAVVVTGARRAFCAGRDLSVEGNVFGLDESLQQVVEEFRAAYDQPPYHDSVEDTGGRVAVAIYALDKPVMAASNGPAVGVGATMTLAMDVRLASSHAQIGFVFGKLGIVAEATSTWFLPRSVCIQQALEWIYRGDILTADEALTGRLLRNVHEPAELVPVARELARSSTNNRSPVAIAFARQLRYRGCGAVDSLGAHLAESLAMYWTSITNGKEGIAAFGEKRAARFGQGTSSKPVVC